MDDIENPPKLLDMAQERMKADADREQERDAARRLSLEGGEADPDDVKLFELRWEFNMKAPARRWTGALVTEAIEGGVDFRLSTLNTQRRADIYNALTEWSQWAGQSDLDTDQAFRAALTSVCIALPATGPLGVMVGSLTTMEAAALRNLVTEIVEGRMAYVIELDGAPRWEQLTSSES